MSTEEETLMKLTLNYEKTWKQFVKYSIEHTHSDKEFIMKQKEFLNKLGALEMLIEEFKIKHA